MTVFFPANPHRCPRSGRPAGANRPPKPGHRREANQIRCEHRALFFKADPKELAKSVAQVFIDPNRYAEILIEISHYRYREINDFCQELFLELESTFEKIT